MFSGGIVDGGSSTSGSSSGSLWNATWAPTNALVDSLGLSNPLCANHSATIHADDRCPGLCYHTIADDGRAWYMLVVIAILLAYNTGYFLLKRSKEKVHDHEAEHWVAMMLQGRPKDTKQPVLVMQTMRCSLQGTQAFSAAAGAVAAYGLLVSESDRHERNLFLFLSLVNWFAVYCFAEQMRYINHLSFLAVRTRPLSRGQIPDEFLFFLRDVLDTGDIDPVYHDPAALSAYVCDDRIAPFVEGDSHEAYYMNIETFATPEMEMERVSGLLRTSFTYFAIGVRAFFASIPFYFGFVSDNLMIVGSFFIIAFQLFYFDELLDLEGGTFAATPCVRAWRWLQARRRSKGKLSTHAVKQPTHLSVPPSH